MAAPLGDDTGALTAQLDDGMSSVHSDERVARDAQLLAATSEVWQNAVPVGLQTDERTELHTDGT